jgi:2-polyprenyl-3-methyl-5-hydroxy-6-metoxy-1,4-benzoquinol methylase
MIKQKERRMDSGNIFNEAREYYKQDWHDYYPTVIRLVPPNSYVLDVGCGRGGLLEYLRDKKNCRVMGLDISDDAIKICKEKGIKVIKCDLEEEELPGTYDVIILSAVIEHLIDPLSLLDKIRDNLNENGCVVVGVPNFSHLMARIQYLLGKNVKIFGDTEEDKKLGIQPPGHIQFFNKATLSFLLERTGYDPIEWCYHKSQSFSANPKLFFPKKVIAWIFYKLYQIDHELFSVFIAVKAVKK